MTSAKNLERVSRSAVDPEMAPEAVTGAARYQAKDDPGTDQRSGHLVHRAVATDRDHAIAASGHRAGSESGGVAGAAL